MELVFTPNLKELLAESHLLIDTCTVIDASKCSEVYSFLKEVKKRGCTLLSVKAVRDEYLCSASSLEEYKELLMVYSALNMAELPQIDQLLVESEGAYFNMALSRCKGIHPSHVDRMLLFAAYFYGKAPNNVYLMTSNHKDVPEELFDCVGFISHNIGGFHNIGVYEVNKSNIKKKMTGITHAKIKEIQDKIKKKERNKD